MDHISDSLGKRLNQRALAATAQSAYICHVADSLSAGRFRAVSFRKGLLTLGVPTAGAAQDLKLESRSIQLAINAALPSATVVSLRVIVRA